MKKDILTWAGVLVLILVAVLAGDNLVCGFFGSDNIKAENYHIIDNGMTEFETQALLGRAADEYVELCALGDISRGEFVSGVWRGSDVWITVYFYQGKVLSKRLGPPRDSMTYHPTFWSVKRRIQRSLGNFG